MRKLILFFTALFFTFNAFSQNVSGTATNAETGAPLAGFDILLTWPNGGIADEALTGDDGSFVFTDVEDGTYGLEFYTYPDPVMINGDYFMMETYDDDIVVDGGNVSGIMFEIPPHHPTYTLTGALLDATTNDTINIQNFQVRAKLKYYVEFFYDFETDAGTYTIENMPDWTYEFNIFENDYYEGVATEITIDPMSPDTIHMDYYLEPKMGATVSGVLLDSTTGDPILMAGRTIVLSAPNSLFTETNDQGEFTFINVPPGTYGSIYANSQDTSYVNTTLSRITGVTVPPEGLDGIELYQKPWISIHHITADITTFVPGETETVKFSIVNDDLSYGAIWGVNLILPEGVTIVNPTPFYSYANNEVIFDTKPDCSSDMVKAWEGWHFVGIPPYASAEGNLDVLNESAFADLTLEFADSASMENAPIFYEIFYDIHCYTIMPFSFGTIMMENDESVTGINNPTTANNRVISYPNPAADQANIRVNLDQTREGSIVLYDLTGQEVMNTGNKIYQEGNNTVRINTSRLNNGIYHYNFLADDLKLTGKLVVSR